jgi:outer membrane receptor protein involved in Fe transport
MNIQRFLGATALVGVLSALPAVAYAEADKSAPAAAPQTTTPQTTSPADPEATPQTDTSGEKEITITGSRIRSPNATSIIPITSISGDTLFTQGRNNVGDTLNDLPQLRSTFAQQNPGLGVGIAGLNLLDLRGLGTVRTLVLVNGRRHVGSDILNNATSVDINTIPTDLVERIDIVTGGNSAVYGSDAIAGVVNFVLKQNFDGVQIRGNAGVAGAGFGGNQYVSVVAGKNFSDGRGNVTVSGEYAHQERVFASDVPWYRTQDGLFVTDVDPSGLTNGSDGFPDRSYLRDVRSSTINRYGLIPINQPASNPTCGVGLGQTNGAPGSTGSGGGTNGVPYSCGYIFTQDGRLVQETGTRFGSGPNSGLIGGNGQSGREEKLLSVYPYQQRFNFNMLGHYTFAPAIEAFVEAKWTRIEALGSNAGPSFTQGTGTQFDSREKVRLDNPFLNPADRTTLANLILASGCNTSFTSVCTTLSPTDIANINNGSYRMVIGRQFADSGIRDEYFKRDTYRIVGGLRGTFNDDWSYELSANYGQMNQTTTTYGYVDKQRFMLSFDAGRNPVTGQIQCRSQFSPAAAIAFPNTAFNQARLASDIAACVPYNPFGGLDNSAAAKYFVHNEVDRARMTQFDLLAYISGDSSQLFSLPGGPVRFSIGGEYRSETARYDQDPFDFAGRSNAIPGLSFAGNTFKVKEAYGEIQIPILKDVPFFHDLSASGAARVSWYQGGIGTVWTYNYGGEWAPTQDIRFRGTYGRAVRAPNVTETGSPLVPNFAPGFIDPCRASAIGTGSGTRAKNCQDDLGALLTTGSFANQATYSLPVVSGSNPNLKPETSDSWTIGGVLTPRWIKGFTVSVDYYNIRVNGVITSVTAQTIANNCYDAATLNNPFCALFTRYRGTGNGPLGEVPGQILGNSLIQAPLNFAKYQRKGIDTQINYTTRLSSNVRLSTNLIYTHSLKASNYTNTTDPTREDRLLSELGNPRDEFQWDTDLTVGAVTFGYRLHFIGPMYLNTFEDFNSLQGRAPENADYASFEKYPSVAYHSVRVQWDLKNGNGFGKSYQMFFGVDNLLDKHPPLGSTATGSGSAIYDFRGRNFYAGFRAGF